MPRRRRGWIDWGCYHITHRCHEREFLFKFSRHRDIYLRQLWETKKRFKVDILDYMVTSNHVHLLLTARHGRDISCALQFLHGSVGQQYNLLKKREGAFWSDRFHSTHIQSGSHLSRCLFYIDMNMVRAGAVRHPEEWKHSGIHELLGKRQRYQLINMGRLLQYLDIQSEEAFLRWYIVTLNDLVASNNRQREAYWSEAIAVGEPDWLKTTAVQSGIKRYAIKNAIPDDREGDIYILTGK